MDKPLIVFLSSSIVDVAHAGQHPWLPGLQDWYIQDPNGSFVGSAFDAHIQNPPTTNWRVRLVKGLPLIPDEVRVWVPKQNRPGEPDNNLGGDYTVHWRGEFVEDDILPIYKDYTGTFRVAFVGNEFTCPE